MATIGVPPSAVITTRGYNTSMVAGSATATSTRAADTMFGLCGRSVCRLINADDCHNLFEQDFILF